MVQVIDYPALFRASPYPYLLIDTNFILLGANPAYLRATRKQIGEIVGKHVIEVFPSTLATADCNDVYLSIKIAVNTRKPHTTTLLQYDDISKEKRCWSLVHTPVLNDAGDVAYVAQNPIDVTSVCSVEETSHTNFLEQELKAASVGALASQLHIHEAMRRVVDVERDKFRTLFDQSPGFIAVLGTDHVFQLVNQAYFQLVGHSEVVGRPIREVLPEGTAQTYAESLDSVMKTGEPILQRVRNLTVQREPDGPHTEIDIDILFKPVLNAEGRINAIFSQGVDVTQMVQVEEQLRTRLTELEGARAGQDFLLKVSDVVRQVSDSSLLFDGICKLIGHHLQVSRVVCGEYDARRKLVTYRSNYVDPMVSEFIGTYPTAIFGEKNFAQVEDGSMWVCDDLSNDPRTCGPDTWPTFKSLDIYAAVVVPLTRQGKLIECLFITSSVPRHWSDEELRLLKDASERLWIAVERVRAKVDLEQADQRKDQFLATLAHELRNPLAPISAAAELLEITNLSADKLRDISGILVRQVSHMTDLVSDLLDVSRIKSGLVVLDRHEVDIKRVVSEAVEQARPLIEARKHILAVEMTAITATVFGDHNRLVQVLVNLLSNSAKYTPDGGSILVRVDAFEEHVVISVADNGLGISSDLLPQLFVLFVQEERSWDGGLGLGLPLVKSLVDLHGGVITVESAGKNAGSKFIVQLPRLLKLTPEEQNSAEETSH